MENSVPKPHNYLTERDYQTIKEGLDAVVVGQFLSNECLHTLTGVIESQMEAVWKDWPNVDFNSEVVQLAVNNALANLWAYPHGREAEWGKYITVSAEDMYETLQRRKRTVNL